MSGKLSVWSDASDGYDADLDVLTTIGDGPGFVGVHHTRDVNGWLGPTGFYFNDLRAPLGPDESKTWSPIHVWASENYTDPLMWFSVQAEGPPYPPRDRKYSLRLAYVPEGLMGAPDVGTVWTLPAGGETLTIEMPTWSTSDGLTGYQFELTMSAIVPEPGTLTSLVLVALRRRR